MNWMFVTLWSYVVFPSFAVTIHLWFFPWISERINKMLSLMMDIRMLYLCRMTLFTFSRILSEDFKGIHYWNGKFNGEFHIRKYYQKFLLNKSMKWILRLMWLMAFETIVWFASIHNDNHEIHSSHSILFCHVFF